MKIKPINSGILSFGMSGRVFHAPFIHSNPHFNLTAIVERTTKSAGHIYPDIKSYDNVSELLGDDNIELVVVNTPNHTHFQFALEALQAGKHVLLEKPAVEKVEELEKLLEVSKKNNKQLFFYQNRRFDSNFLEVEEIIKSGQLGEIIEVHFRFDRYKMELGQKNFKENSQYISSGLIYDLGPHLIDQAISLFGKPSKFTKTSAIHRPGSQVADYFNFHLSYPNNLNVFLTANLLVVDPQPAFVIHGTKGSFIKNMADVQEQQLINGMLPTEETYGIESKGNEGKLVTVDSSGKKQTSFLPAKRGNYNLLFNAVYENLRNLVAYPVTAEQIKWQIEMMESEDFEK